MPNPPEASRSLGYWIGRAGLSVASLLLMAVGLELGARAWVAFREPPILDHRTFRATRPAPYRDAPYFSDEFLAESFEQPGGWNTPEGTRIVLPNDYRGAHFNVTGGVRRTAFQPPAAESRVLLLGGSTVYNSEVPDEFTIASHLQLLLNERFGGKYRVENLGVTSVNVSQQVERLETVDLEAGDLVIFFDGANDVLQSIYFRNPSGWIVGENRDALERMPGGSRLILFLYDRLGSRSEFVRVFLDPFDPVSAPAHLGDREILEELVDEMTRNYREQILRAERICARAGASFHHFLQPNLFTLARRTGYERELVEQYSGTHIIPGGLETAFSEGYPALAAVVRDLPSEGVRSSDITDTLDERREGEEFYLDWIHVNHRGNARIARRIFETIFPAGPPP